MTTQAPPEIVLASRSPRRRELLTLAGVRHRIEPSEIDEHVLPDESPEIFTRRIARLKAETVAEGAVPGTWILAADTTVVIDNQLLGKPMDIQDARRMLERLSDRSHRVLTAVTLLKAGSQTAHHLLEETVVQFRRLTPAWITAYLDTGEPMDKAGAYGIQGQGAMLVKSISGSYTNVVGLPLCETITLLESTGAWSPAQLRTDRTAQGENR